ncbi:leucine zipper domain-containing protein [Saccharothrix algeriensis]|uniref:leucine zipper domain-containing protein n=1 Tax=Saccharothrix algeriensis TaxID=173560 RepID=UPI003556D8B2
MRGRYRCGGRSGLLDRSSRPHRSSRRLPVQVEQRTPASLRAVRRGPEHPASGAIGPEHPASSAAGPEHPAGLSGLPRADVRQRPGGLGGCRLVGKVPLATLRRINSVLGADFITGYGARQGITLFGRVVPFDIGAVIGGGANTAGDTAGVHSGAHAEDTTRTHTVATLTGAHAGNPSGHPPGTPQETPPEEVPRMVPESAPESNPGPRPRTG